VAIYLDHNATTPVAASVREAMAPYLADQFGNPSSGHPLGRAARRALESARERIAAYLGAGADEVLLVGSGSEANNLALRGAALAEKRPGRNTVVTQCTEHPSVLRTCDALRRLHGYRVVELGVDEFGVVDLEQARAAIDHSTAVVSVQVANGETGTLQPIGDLVDLAHRHGAVVHADACQAAGKIPVDVAELGVDLLSIAGHKMYAPKGVAALYRRNGVQLEPVVYGGGQELGVRSGTENVAFAVALAAACVLTGDIAQQAGRLKVLRETLFDALSNALRRPVILNGHPTRRLPNTVNLSIEGVDGDEVLRAATEIAASTGSACHAGSPEPSPVLLAMGCPPERARGAVRLSLGRDTGADEVRRAVYLVARAVNEVGATGRAAVPAQRR
jgi:cysteine desulfurase